MYSFPSFEPVCCSMAVLICFLTAYRFLRRQVTQSGIPISWRIIQFVVSHTVKVFGVINKTEVDVFLVFSCFFYDPTDDGNLISGSSAFSKYRLNIWKFTVHTLLKPGLENLQHYFASMWDECSCAVVWTFLMFKLVLEKAEEPEIKLPASAGSSKQQESSRKESISALLTMPKPLTVWITINCGKSWKRWEYQTTWPTSWKTYMQARRQ